MAEKKRGLAAALDGRSRFDQEPGQSGPETYERTYTRGPKAGQTEVVTNTQRASVVPEGLQGGEIRSYSFPWYARVGRTLTASGCIRLA